MATIFLPLGNSRVYAQEIPRVEDGIADDAMYILSPASLRKRNPLLKRTRNYQGLRAGDFVLYPSLLAGVVIDDNLSWSRTRPKTATGARLKPALLVARDTGKHKTTVYGEVDVNYFPSIRHGNVTAGRLGFVHHWEIQRDLHFKAGVDYTRAASYVGGGTTRSANGTLSTIVATQFTNQTRAGIALQKSFGRYFVGVSAEMLHSDYSSLRTTTGVLSQNYRNNTYSRLSARGGVWFAPVFYAFGEASVNARHYGSGTGQSRGHRIVAGVGSDRISLFRGELYAGLHREFYSQKLIPTSSDPVFGGKIYWYPTRAWIVNLSLEQAYSSTSVPTPGNPNGFPQRMTTLAMYARYQMARNWNATVRGAVFRANYLGVNRRDTGWNTALSVNYDIRRNLTFSLDLEHYQMASNEKTAGYTHSIYKLGAKYRY
ncbi:MAG: outer membrane beta-barrel protein [Hyphomicrobiales bacterium]|nr:outer membrane beta-barrel protein [Hyphomicrobiales bacterium]